MRNLLVAAPGHLAPAVTDAFRDQAWALSYLQSVDAARALDGDQDYSVGLAVFPELRQPDDQHTIRQMVFSCRASMGWRPGPGGPERQCDEAIHRRRTL